MSQMAPTVTAHNFRPGHAEGAVRVPRYSPGDAIEICRPSTARLELVRGFVERGIAGGAGVDAGGGHVLVVFPSVRRFGAFFAEDTELLCEPSVLGTQLYRQEP